MPISRVSFLRTSALLLVIGLFALLAIIGTTIWLVERSQEYFDQSTQARQMRTSVSSLRTSMVISEASQRGYLLTHDARYLEPYDEYRPRIPRLYTAMVDALSSNPEFKDRVEQLKAVVDAKVSEMDETIALSKAGRSDQALEIVRSGIGRRTMDQAREFFEEAVAQIDDQLATSIDQRRNIANILNWAVPLGGLIILMVVGGAVWMALAYTRELVEARSEVETLNAGLEARVRERTSDLMAANEEVQRFAYIVTHDLRAPLVNIMGFTSELETTLAAIKALVLDDTKDEHLRQQARDAVAEDLPEAIGFIRSSTRKMDALINAILKISRDGRRPVKPEKVDLEAMLTATLASVHHQIGENEGSAEVLVKPGAIISDRMSLEQIFGNLLDNAVKYRSPERKLEIKISARREGADRILIDVADNGRGIAKDDYDRVFDLFRRAGIQDKPGEGIGLAHVRTLARNLGGDIKLASEAGIGSTFTVDLPVNINTVLRSAAK